MTDRTEQILDIFTELSVIPRQSGNRGPVKGWITSWAEEHGFEWKSDKIDNILIKVPASEGLEDRPTLILQGHSDMVCEKTPDSDHDFSRDPLDLYRDGEWLRARNTTLGADNGIALAMAFDLALNPEVSHGPLEILITSDEEIGLLGANGLESDFLSGRTLINIDSEDEGVLTVGCAGGSDCHFDFEGEWEKAEGEICEILIDGLTGGHSGVDINKGRASAIQLAGRLLAGLLDENLSLVDFQSGSGATNALARRAELVLLVKKGGVDRNQAELSRWEEIFKAELGQADSNLTISLDCKGPARTECLGAASFLQFIDLILSLPHGVVSLSREIDNLVETSANLAAVKKTGKTFHFSTSQRSSVMSRLKEINLRTVASARLAGCTNIVSNNRYPSWQPDWDSSLLAKTKEIYGNLYDREAVVEVIHAGLETGIIGSKYKGMDMISLGPTIENPHSPDERLLIPSIQMVYNLIFEIIRSI
ncbi:MAG: beta-Ala-His dipeptidase [Spirochaetales bacterium]|nr:beta-Ala-His dipeptidase [Spirochaetales bacterium]